MPLHDIKLAQAIHSAQPEAGASEPPAALLLLLLCAPLLCSSMYTGLLGMHKIALLAAVMGQEILSSPSAGLLQLDVADNGKAGKISWNPLD